NYGINGIARNMWIPLKNFCQQSFVDCFQAFGLHSLRLNCCVVSFDQTLKLTVHPETIQRAACEPLPRPSARKLISRTARVAKSLPATARVPRTWKSLGLRRRIQVA